jgi:ribosomal protein S18 acetylase RimI-like enzyme
MLSLDIRSATEQDADLITSLIRRMVTEMAQFDGHPVNGSPQVWSRMVDLVKANCLRQDHAYLIASTNAMPGEAVGMVAAQIEILEEIFAAGPRLHLSAIYVIPAYRRQSVASRLIRGALEWGSQMEVEAADLNVLLANPARQLYERLGFQPSEVRMVKKLNY